MDKRKLTDSREVRKQHNRRLKERFSRVMEDDIMREQCMVPFLRYIGVQTDDLSSAEIWDALQCLDSSEKKSALESIDSAIDAYDQACRRIHEIESRGQHVDRGSIITREVQHRLAGIATTNRGKWAESATREELISQIMPGLDRIAKRLPHDTPGDKPV